MLTGNTEKDSVVQALQAGAQDYIIEPFKPRELLSRVERFLGALA
jgi:two-component system phosphate regulon response regulator PhoB